VKKIEIGDNLYWLLWWTLIVGGCTVCELCR
jgi:hypothetical protein